MAETIARLAEAEKQIAELKEQNAWLDLQLQSHDPIYGLRRSLPSHQEAAKLLRIVCGRYPHLKENNPEQICVDNFLASLAYVFSVTQTTTPTVAYQGSWWLGEANKWVSNSKIHGRVRTLVPAIIATGSIPFVLDHGVIYLDPHRARGKLVDRDSWKRILNGGELLQATPVRTVDDRSIGHVNFQSAW